MLPSKTKTMIRWKLRELMAKYKITNRQLAEALDKHETSISRIKTSDTMPRLDGEQLNDICQGLTICLWKKRINRLITPEDLIEYTWDGGPLGDAFYEVDASNVVEIQSHQSERSFPGRDDGGSKSIA